MAKLRIALASLGLFAIVASPAAAQQPAAAAQTPPVSADPQTTAATFGDWILGCVALQDAAKSTARRCEITQSIQVQGAGRIAQVVVGRMDAKAPLLLTVVLPSNISFGTAVRVSVDEKDAQPVDLAWQRCLPGGCFSNIELKDDVLKRYRALHGTRPSAIQGRGRSRDYPANLISRIGASLGRPCQGLRPVASAAARCDAGWFKGSHPLRADTDRKSDSLAKPPAMTVARWHGPCRMFSAPSRIGAAARGGSCR